MHPTDFAADKCREPRRTGPVSGAGVEGAALEAANFPVMGRVLAIALSVCVWVAAAAASSASAEAPRGDAGAADATLFAAGGTPVSNGVFFPGTVIYDGYDFVGEPMPVQRGSNIRFVNLDPAAVTNSHKIRSFKLRRGRPVFESKTVNGPGETLVITSHLKPGVYYYFCTTHTTMYGGIRITD